MKIADTDGIRLPQVNKTRSNEQLQHDYSFVLGISYA